jgi:hypothetical protein
MKEVPGNPWISTEIVMTLERSMDVHGNALTSPIINAALNGEVKQFLTNLIP